MTTTNNAPTTTGAISYYTGLALAPRMAAAFAGNIFPTDTTSLGYACDEKTIVDLAMVTDTRTATALRNSRAKATARRPDSAGIIRTVTQLHEMIRTGEFKGLPLLPVEVACIAIRTDPGASSVPVALLRGMADHSFVACCDAGTLTYFANAAGPGSQILAIRQPVVDSRTVRQTVTGPVVICNARGHLVACISPLAIPADQILPITQDGTMLTEGLAAAVEASRVNGQYYAPSKAIAPALDRLAQSCAVVRETLLTALASPEFSGKVQLGDLKAVRACFASTGKRKGYLLASCPKEDAPAAAFMALRLHAAPRKFRPGACMMRGEEFNSRFHRLEKLISGISKYAPALDYDSSRLLAMGVGL